MAATVKATQKFQPRSDIDLQKECDARRAAITWEVVAARWDALVDARDHDTYLELGADWAYRQALVDLSAACEGLAGTMKVPMRPRP